MELKKLCFLFLKVIPIKFHPLQQITCHQRQKEGEVAGLCSDGMWSKAVQA